MDVIGKKERVLGGQGVTIKKIESFMKNYESYLQYDNQNECMIATIKIKEEDKKPIINGKTLYKGTYYFYFENSKSMEEKIKLAEENNLRGIAAWSLGQESDEVWSTYSKYLDKNDENIVDTGVDKSFWANDAILFVNQKGWLLGRDNNEFYPNDKLTRAEFATIIARILELDVNLSYEKLYEDTLNHWAEKSINAVSKTGFMEGYIGGEFKPNNYITREEVSKVLSFLIKDKVTNQTVSFTDVGENRWSYMYINKMSRNGILTGYLDNTFRPENDITRAEIAVILMRMFAGN